MNWPMRVSDGWEACNIFSTGGPIVLVEFRSTKEPNRLVKSRLDLGKVMMIDALPFALPDRALKDISKFAARLFK